MRKLYGALYLRAVRPLHLLSTERRTSRNVVNDNTLSTRSDN